MPEQRLAGGLSVSYDPAWIKTRPAAEDQSRAGAHRIRSTPRRADPGITAVFAAARADRQVRTGGVPAEDHPAGSCRCQHDHRRRDPQHARGAGKPGVRTPPAQPCRALGCPSGTSANLPDLPVLASFDAFFKGAKTSLYDDRARAAFRVVQAFVNPEHAHLLHVGLERSSREEFRWALLHRMDALR